MGHWFSQRQLLFLTLFGFALFYTHSLFPLSDESVQIDSRVTPLGWKGIFTLLAVIVTLVCLVKEIKPPDIVMFVCAAVLAVSGVLTSEQFLKGFSSDIIMIIAMLCVIVRTLEINGMLNIFTKKILPSKATGIFAKSYLLTPIAVLSAFLNNTVIVLMMTPVVRKWAIEKQSSPSKFLIPISYASIVGGLCTVIGTSTNVIIDGLLRRNNPDVSLSFFELGYVGLPCTIAVLAALVTFIPYLLPVRQDISSAISQQTREFTGEFIVEDESPFANTLLKDAGGKHFHRELLIEIERNGRIITAPGPYDVILEGDRLIFAGDIHQIAELHTVSGLRSAADPHFTIDENSTHFSEVVVSLTSNLIGKTLQQINFRSRYGASVLAVYRQGKRIPGNVGEIALDAGDTLFLLSTESWHPDRYLRDFYNIRHSERVTIYNPGKTTLIIAILLGMIGGMIYGFSILTAVVFAALMLYVTRCITIREAQKGVLWNVLLLIASSFAVATAVDQSGLARFIAEILLSIVGTDPHYLIAGILISTCIFTEFLSNNAAALLIFPVALQAALLGGYTSPEALKTIGVTVAVGASCGFALPTGYQTHMIVYGPGGYRFTDFMRVGAIIDGIVIAVAIYLIPKLWPLV